MGTSRFLTILSILILASALTASAQRTRRPAPRPTPKPTPARQTVNPVVAAAKQQVANQLYNVNVFVDKMGPVAVAIENADKAAAARRLKQDEIAANEVNKQKIIAAIRGLRDGLMALETDFRTKPQLAQYSARIQGISTLCGRSEDSAIAGRFVASKDPLRQIAIKLNETLAVLPGTVLPDRPSGVNTRTPSSSNQIRPAPAGTSPARPVVNQNVSNTRREAAVGMTPADVLASTWGAPSSKRVSTSQNGKTEVWLYSGNRAVYFFNGRATRIAQ